MGADRGNLRAARGLGSTPRELRRHRGPRGSDDRARLRGWTRARRRRRRVRQRGRGRRTRHPRGEDSGAHASRTGHHLARREPRHRRARRDVRLGRGARDTCGGGNPRGHPPRRTMAEPRASGRPRATAPHRAEQPRSRRLAVGRARAGSHGHARTRAARWHRGHQGAHRRRSRRRHRTHRRLLRHRPRSARQRRDGRHAPLQCHARTASPRTRPRNSTARAPGCGDRAHRGRHPRASCGPPPRRSREAAPVHARHRRDVGRMHARWRLHAGLARRRGARRSRPPHAGWCDRRIDAHDGARSAVRGGRGRAAAHRRRAGRVDHAGDCPRPREGRVAAAGILGRPRRTGPVARRAAGHASRRVGSLSDARSPPRPLSRHVDGEPRHPGLVMGFGDRDGFLPITGRQNPSRASEKPISVTKTHQRHPTTRDLTRQNQQRMRRSSR
ncbi:hypothetical protein PSCLAVI8L_490019 [Pseudoclavibacter sp. 8L]|nr:hypothetical protein PSCLAVI8L_490019 [Pseudoclavibacter sp. 8L]